MYLTPKQSADRRAVAPQSRTSHRTGDHQRPQIRDLLQNLKNNLPVWYAPDQRYTGKNSEIVPFFGQPAASNVATSRLAKISGAPVLPYFPEAPRRQPRLRRARSIAPLDNFPSDDPVADTRRFHELIEATCAIIRSSTSGRTSASSGRGPTATRTAHERSTPRYWPTWLALGMLRVFEPLPFPLLVWLGRSIGELMRALPLGVRAHRAPQPRAVSAGARSRRARTHPARALPQPRHRHFRNGDQLVELRRAHSQADAARRRGASGGGARARSRRDPAERAFHDAGNRRSRAVRAGRRRTSCIGRRATSCSNASSCATAVGRQSARSRATTFAR